MGQTIASLDYIIDEIINDPRILILENGHIYFEKTPTNYVRYDYLKKDGYMGICYYSYSRKKQFQIKAHRIIYKKFIGDLNPLLEINHKNSDKTDNNITNLELISESDNKKHARLNKLFKHSENHPISKLTEKEVIEVFKMRNAKYSLKQISKHFNVGITAINNILEGKTWKYFSHPEKDKFNLIKDDLRCFGVTPDTVQQIKKDIINNMSVNDIALKNNCSKKTVYNIKSGKHYV